MLDSVNEKDLENLEAYLDGALEMDHADALQARLAQDPALQSVLDDLRAQRAVRRAIWCENEPSPATVMRLNARIEHAMQRTGRGAFWRNLSRWGTTAAACVLIGMWIGNSAMPGGSSRSALPSAASSAGGASIAANHPVEWTGGYHVSLLDDSGQVQAVQQFSTLEQAREFANDIGRWQARRQQVRQGRIQLIADQF